MKSEKNHVKVLTYLIIILINNELC